MRVPGGGLHLRVTEQLPDHREALAQGQRPRSITVAKVMNSHVFEPGTRADAAPGALEISEMGARHLAADDPGIVLLAGQVGQHGTGLGPERHDPPPGLGVRQLELAGLKLDMLPTQLLDFRESAAGEHQQADRRKGIMGNPRDLHRELFASFTPTDYPECAGTYRGTPDTSLADIRMSTGSQIDPEVVYEFCPPRELPWRTQELGINIHSLLNEPGETDYDKLLALAYTFCRFGKIHPFLDGNGHVQRAVFAVMATEFGFLLSPRFAIHPRPFDRLLAVALENLGRAPEDEEQEDLGLVAEYLAFFLDGPFNAPRKHVGIASLYSS